MCPKISCPLAVHTLHYPWDCEFEAGSVDEVTGILKIAKMFRRPDLGIKTESELKAGTTSFPPVTLPFLDVKRVTISWRH
jgi:hypothetical protein